MTVRLSEGLRTGTLSSGIAALLDGGNGRINIYTGSQPATAATAATGTLLATLTLASDAMGTPSAGSVAFSAITSDTNIDATGTAGWGRIYRTTDTAPGSTGDSDDLRIDFSIGTSGQDVNFDSVSFVAGGTAAISSLTITMPAG